MQPPFPLFLRPFDRLVAGFEVKGGRAPAEQSQPVTVGVGDHVAKLFPDKVGILEVMVPADQLVPAGSLLGRHQRNLDALQEGLFAAIRQSARFRHPHMKYHSEGNVPKNRFGPRGAGFSSGA
jgi:hypothetical protein